MGCQGTILIVERRVDGSGKFWRSPIIKYPHNLYGTFGARVRNYAALSGSVRIYAARRGNSQVMAHRLILGQAGLGFARQCVLAYAGLFSNGAKNQWRSRCVKQRGSAVLFGAAGSFSKSA